MGQRQDYTVVELDGARLSAIGARVAPGGVEVTRWHTAIRPDSISADNAEAIGAWLGRELGAAGLTKSRVVMAVGRNDVVLKAISLPVGGGLDAAAVSGAVRLQMVRQLTMSMEGTAIDYVRLPEHADGTGGAGVMAAAMPGERVAWCRNVMRAAGCTLRRIGLRAAGAAAVLGEVSQRRSGAAMGVVVGAGTTEFVVVEDGQMVMARSAEATRPTGEKEFGAFALRLAVEAKRTWMSFRSATPGPEVEFVGVLGDGALARAVAEGCGAALGAPGEVVGLPSVAERSCNVPEEDRGSVTALAGLLAEGVLNRESLDFANPRRAPDMAARRRQMAMAAALLVVVVGGTGYVGAQKSLGRLRAELAEAQADEASLKKQVEQYLAAQARISHIDQWRSARVEWLPHIKRLSDQLPDPHDSVTNELIGRMAAGTAYDPKGTSAYPGGAWGTTLRTTFDLSGKVDNRTVAADLRERLLSDGVYQVESRGADTPDRFSIELMTSQATPVAKATKATDKVLSGNIGGKGGKS